MSARASGAKKSAARASKKETPIKRRACGAMSAHMRLLETNPSFRGNQFKLESATSKLRTSAFDAKLAPIATVRVVVHVVYKTDAENISDAQIKSQIAAMNKDFRATNPDKSKTPAPWKGLVTDARVNFVLDSITRTNTTKSSFGDDAAVKKASGGAIAPADTTRNGTARPGPRSDGSPIRCRSRGSRR